MQYQRIPFDKIPSLSHKDIFYQLHTDKLRDFFSFSPDLEGLGRAIEERRKFPVDRELLVQTLHAHYSVVGATQRQQQAIASLRDNNTFTVITAHQPSVLGGPAYYFYKIYSTIQLALQLEKAFPSCRFVPVFVNGSEDHDFDEVRSVHMFGKTVEWQTHQEGAVGRFTTEGLAEVIREIALILGDSPAASRLAAIWQQALERNTTYNGFVFDWMNQYFGDQGLLVLTMDDPGLKRAFLPVMEEEIDAMPSERLVRETQDALAAVQFKPQAFAREVNLFYMDEGLRERISWTGTQYVFVNSGTSFSREQLIALLRQHPERFSPNVVLRPLYQESILPNLAYVGGGGEIAYWLERKKQFSHFGVFFPALIRRNSVLLVPPGQKKAMDKLDLTVEDLFLPEEQLVGQYLDRVSQGEFHLDAEKDMFHVLFEKIATRARSIDPTLEPYTLSEGQKLVKSLDGIEARLKKAVRQKEDTQIQQLRSLKHKLFPGGGLQERHDSFIQFVAGKDAAWLEEFSSLLDPLEKDFLIVFL